MLFNNKKGYYTVFLCLIFSGVIILLMALIWISIQIGVSSGVNSYGNLSGQSILAEYDSFLHDRYRLYGFDGNYYDTPRKLEYYLSYTEKSQKYATLDSVSIDLEDYKFTYVNEFKKQITDAVKSGVGPIPKYGYNNKSDESATSVNRYVTAEWIIEQLPSKKRASYLNVNSVINSLNNNSYSDNFDFGIVDQYIFGFFKYHDSVINLGDTFFSNEIEYILSGKLNDNQSYRHTKNLILSMRTGLNSSYIWSCPEKAEACLSIGVILFPELTPIVAQAIIVEAWATMEAENDIKILEDKKQVPFIKNDRNFALSLSSVLSQNYNVDNEGNPLNHDNKYNKPASKKDYVEPQVIEGQYYEDYLRTLISFVPEEIKLLRIMDLIQINGKFLYADYFNLNQYYTGLKYELVVNGKKYDFERKYDESVKE